MTPTEYITAARRLVHDPDAGYWTDAAVMLPAALDAIKERDRATACRREYISLALTPGTRLYEFSDLSNERVFDVVNIYVLLGTRRVQLDRMSFTKLNTGSYSSGRSQLYGWTRYGAASVYFGGTPDIAYTTEWDCCTFSGEIATGTDDGIPYPYTKPVPYYIAHLAKLNERQWDEADAFLDRFTAECGNLNGYTTGIMPVSGR